MIRKILLNKRLKPFLRTIYLWSPTFLSALVYSALRSTGDPRLVHFEKAFETLRSSSTEGDYLEFGVYQGSSFIMASRLARKYRNDTMRFFAFDSFEGLPGSEGSAFQLGEFRCSRTMFSKIVEKGGVDMERVRIVEGLYSDSLTDAVKKDHDLTRASIVHVDCDLYSSTKEVLGFVEDLLYPGSVIIFDDWHAFEGNSNSEESERFGERRAFQEWPLNHCFEELYDSIHGKVFFMCRNP